MKIQYAIGFLFSTATLFSSVAAVNDEKLFRVPIVKRKAPKGTQLGKRDGYTAPVFNDNTSMYLVNVSIGTPPQTFELTLDTGSADLWVPGTACLSSSCTLARFNEQSSSTFKAITSPLFNITYGVGSASGIYGTDTITIAGVTVTNQQFAVVSAQQDIITDLSPTSGSTEGSSYLNNYMDGIFGLGYPLLTASASSYNPFFFNLIQNKQISQSLFSVYLNTAESYGNSGEIIFGGTDSSKYSGTIYYLPIVNTEQSTSNIPSASSNSAYGYWQVAGVGLGVSNSGKQTYLATIAQNQASASFIFDTGTTLTYLPTSVIQDLVYAAVGSDNVAFDSTNNYFAIECAMAKQSVTFQFVMLAENQQTITLNVPISDLVFPLDSDEMDTATICMLGLMPSSDQIILGQSFLRSFYQIYDAGQNRIGVAEAVGSTSSIELDTGNNTGTNSTSSSTISKSSQTTSATTKTTINIFLSFIPCILILIL